MTTALEIIQNAFREGNIVSVGELPTDEQVNESLPRLNNLVQAMFGYEIGEQYADWPVPPARTAPIPARYPLAPYNENLGPTQYPYPPINSRIITKIATNETVYLPFSPSPGARVAVVDIGSTPGFTLTIDANGRLINGAPTLAGDPATDLNGLRLFYREDISDWIRLETLTLESEMPLPVDYDDLWICGLAVRLSGRYRQSVDEVTLGVFNDMKSKVKARYYQRPYINTQASQIQPRTGYYGYTGRRTY